MENLAISSGGSAVFKSRTGSSLPGLLFPDSDNLCLKSLSAELSRVREVQEWCVWSRSSSRISYLYTRSPYTGAMSISCRLPGAVVVESLEASSLRPLAGGGECSSPENSSGVHEIADHCARAFLGQTPIVIVAILLVQRKLQVKTKQQKTSGDDLSISDKIKRIDFMGAALMSLTILCALIVLDVGGQKLPWNHPIIWISSGATVFSMIAFVLVERYVAVEPIFPLRLIGHYVVITCYMMLCLQMVAVTAMMMIVPMYFQVTKLASTGEAGAYLVPSVAGNTIGGLLTGAWIQRSRRYKMPQIIGSFFSMAAFAALVLVWRGNTTFLESLLIFPVGLATGVAHGAIFIGLGAGVGEADIAIAGSGLYLSSNIGSVAGVSLGNAIYQSTLRLGLNKALQDFPSKEQIIRKALVDISYIRHVSADIRMTMLPAYVASFQGVFLLGMACSALALLVGLVSRETRLQLK
ncbi:hypothetical protein CLAIMM_00738 [Cladophialophora immunda]|nr:hypothetical protein CLAIMM_00738 [Cladophialophora immunda]